MKKRLILVVLILTVLFFVIMNASALQQVTDENKKEFGEALTSETSPLSDIEFTPEKSTYETFPDGSREISNLPSITTKTGATGKEISLLKILNEALLIATTVRTFTLPDSIELTGVTNLQYNIIQNFIIVDSAEQIKLLKPFEMPLKNLGKTKIQLNSKNEVQSIETIFKSDQEQEFPSPFRPQQETMSFQSQPNAELNITVKDFKEEKKFEVTGKNLNGTTNDKQFGRRTTFKINKDSITVSEDDGTYILEGKDILTEFESGSYKQFLDNSVKVTFRSQDGFQFIQFLKNGYFTQEFPPSEEILQEDSLTFARSFRISSIEEFNLFIALKDKDNLENFNNDQSNNKAYINLFNHKIILKGIVDYERISAEISDSSFVKKGKKVREIKPLDSQYKKIIESKHKNNLVAINLDENNLFLNASIELKLGPNEKGELFKIHTDSSMIYEFPTNISTKTSRFLKFENTKTPNVLKGFKTNLYNPEIIKRRDDTLKDITQQFSLKSTQKFYSVLEDSKTLLEARLKSHPEGFLECHKMNIKDDVKERYSPYIPLLPLFFLIPLGFLRRKKGNATIIALLGIIVLIIFFVFTYALNQYKASQTPLQKMTAIQDAINDCYKTTLKCGIYYFTVKSDYLIAKDLVYPKEIIESFIKNNVNNCIRSLKEPITISEPSTIKVYFTEKGTELEAEQGILGINTLKGQRLTNFKTSTNIKLSAIYSLIKQIKYSDKEDIPISLLSDLELDAEVYDVGERLVYVIVGRADNFDNREYAFVFSKKRFKDK